MKISSKRVATLALSVALATSSSMAFAGSELMTLLKVLRDNGTITAEQYERVVLEANATEQKNTVEKEEIKVALDKATQVEVIADKGGIGVKSRDGNFTSKIGGRMQLDAAWNDGDSAGYNMKDGTEIRRARLYLKGTVNRDWFYKFEYDFAGAGDTEKGITDIWLGYNGFDFEGASIKAGHFRDPFMLQDQVSDNNTQFTERASIDAFTASRHIGVMPSISRKHWTVAAGLFGESARRSAGTDNDEGWGAGGRATWMPVNEKGELLHLGLAVNYRSQRENKTKIRQQPETHIGSEYFVNTGDLDVDDFLSLGTEFAFVQGPFSAQAEYIQTELDRNGILSDLTFDGWYAQAGWFFTGESRPYTHKGAKFKSVTPKKAVGNGGIGAWELAMRYSTIDLTDEEIVGGEMDLLTMGLNWFPNAGLRISANYIKMLEMDRKGTDYDNEKVDIFQLRTQWAF